MVMHVQRLPEAVGTNWQVISTQRPSERMQLNCLRNSFLHFLFDKITHVPEWFIFWLCIKILQLLEPICELYQQGAGVQLNWLRNMHFDGHMQIAPYLHLQLLLFVTFSTIKVFSVFLKTVLGCLEHYKSRKHRH